MLLVWYIILLVFAVGCLNGTFARNAASLNLSECKAYHRTQGRPKTDEGISTYYLGRICSDFLQHVEDMDDLPDAPRVIDVRVQCNDQPVYIVWVPRVGNDTARKLYGFLLEARLVNSKDFTSTFVCYGIFMDESISSLLLRESVSPPEFEFSCFETTPGASLEASIWSISSQDRNVCQSLHNCSYRVDQYSMVKFDMKPIDKDKWCSPDCNCWKPDWRLMVVTDEYGQCQGLQLHLDDVISSLRSLHFFIVHNETGDVVMDTIVQHNTSESRKSLTLVTRLLQKSGRYYAKLETVCKVQRPSTCPGITKFISDYVSVSCKIPQPPDDPTWRTWMIVCVIILFAVFLTLCYRFQGPIRVCFERRNPVSNVSEFSINNVNNISNASDSLLEEIGHRRKGNIEERIRHDIYTRIAEENVDNLSEGTENANGHNQAEIPNLRNQIIVALLFHSSQKNEVDKVTIMAAHISSFGVQTLIPDHHDLFKNIYDTAEGLAKKATDFVVIWPKKLFSLYNACLKLNDNGERQDVIHRETSHGVLSCCILNYLLEGGRSEFRLHLFVEDSSQKKTSFTDFIESIGKQKHVFTYAKADRDDLQLFVLTLYGAGQTEPEVQTKIETFLSILAS